MCFSLCVLVTITFLLNLSGNWTLPHSSPPLCVKAERKQSFPRCRRSLTSLWPHLSSSRRACRLDKHCQKNFWDWSWRAQPLFNSALFIYVFIKFVLKWGEGSSLPPPPSLNKVCFANREFTASLQALCELPASIWTGDGCSAAKCITTQLFLPT